MTRTLITAVLAASAFALAAAAEDSVVIDVSNVDFSDSAQASAVYEKVVAAAETVCEELYITEAPIQISYSEKQRMYASCVELTLENTLDTAAEPALSEIHAAAPVTSFAVASN